MFDWSKWIDKKAQTANTGYTSGGFQSNLQVPGPLARAVTVDSESATEPARCIPSTLRQCKKPTAQTAHLVFADTKANAEKTKRACFLPTLGQNERNLKTIKKNLK